MLRITFNRPQIPKSEKFRIFFVKKETEPNSPYEYRTLSYVATPDTFDAMCDEIESLDIFAGYLEV